MRAGARHHQHEGHEGLWFREAASTPIGASRTLLGLVLIPPRCRHERRHPHEAISAEVYPGSQIQANQSLRSAYTRITET